MGDVVNQIDITSKDPLYINACINGLTKNTIINNKIWLAGVGPKDARVMVVTPVATEDEVATEKKAGWNYKENAPIMVQRTPRVMEYDLGLTLKDLANREGLDFEKCFCVPIVRYLPDEKKHRTRPLSNHINQCLPLLEKDIERIKPNIIICVGKLVFDALMPGLRLRESDIYGAWFYNKKYNCRVYSTIAIGAVTKPERYERYAFDFKNVISELNKMDGKGIPKVQRHYEVIHNALELMEFTSRLRKENRTILSIDCEWEGHQHVDGKLRSLQICWQPGYAAYIRFMDDALNYVFDVDYKTAGNILGTWLNDPSVKYIGHHLSADLTWIHYWLGLDYYEKGLFDSEFALQCVDEASDLGLDALALRYTDLGKYDLDLIIWRKQNPDKMVDGYGQIPDKILIPYANKDVDTVMRSYPIIWKEIEKQGLVDYYNNILNPMVTDVFTTLCLNGIPIDKAKMDEMRDLYNWAKNEMNQEFQIAVTEEAEHLLLQNLEADGLGKIYDQLKLLVNNKSITEATLLLQNSVPGDAWFNKRNTADMQNTRPAYSSLWEHYLQAPDFNIRSKPQMQRWLFDVKCYMPVKSTSLKDQGMPAMSWEKVLALPPDKQKQFTPASDKGSLEIFCSRHNDKVIQLLLELNSIGNICKAFLKPADVDEEGKLIGENGLHYWAASDNALHCMQSCTETGKNYCPLTEKFIR